MKLRRLILSLVIFVFVSFPMTALAEGITVEQIQLLEERLNALEEEASIIRNEIKQMRALLPVVEPEKVDGVVDEATNAVSGEAKNAAPDEGLDEVLAEVTNAVLDETTNAPLDEGMDEVPAEVTNAVLDETTNASPDEGLDEVPAGVTNAVLDEGMGKALNTEVDMGAAEAPEESVQADEVILMGDDFAVTVKYNYWYGDSSYGSLLYVPYLELDVENTSPERQGEAVIQVVFYDMDEMSIWSEQRIELIGEGDIPLKSGFKKRASLVSYAGYSEKYPENELPNLTAEIYINGVLYGEIPIYNQYFE